MFGNVKEGGITIFYGKMGSGKTSNAVHEIVKFHRRGSPVWVNFPILKLPLPKGEDAGVWFEDDPAGILSMRHGLFVLDEAYLTLNSREWAKLPKEVFVAFTHARKLDMTIIVIAQSWMRIDKSIREVASFAREFRGGSFFGRLYPYVEYEVDEMGEIVKGEPVEYASAVKGFSLFGRSVYEAYDTDFLFSDNRSLKQWRSAINYDPRAAAPLARPLRPSPEPAPLS